MINNKVEAIKEHLEEIMKILEIERTESNKNTPLRVAKMWVNELFANVNNAQGILILTLLVNTTFYLSPAKLLLVMCRMMLSLVFPNFREL